MDRPHQTVLGRRTIETAREPIETDVALIVRTAKDGSHRHFLITEDIDPEGSVIALRGTKKAR